MKKISILAIFFLLFLSGATGVSIAHADTLLPFDTTISGTITEQKSLDAYTVTIPKAGTLKIQFKAYFSAAYLELKGADGKTVEHAEALFQGRPDNATELKKVFYIEPGTYTLNVQDFNKTSFGDYSLHASFDPANANVSEPNQTFAQAMPIQMNGETIRGFFSYKNRMDYFKFELDEPGRLFIDIDSQASMASLNVYDQEDSSSFYWQRINSYVGVPVRGKYQLDLAKGTYFISMDGSSLDYPGVYNMDVTFDPANSDDIEPNNSKETAIPLDIHERKTYNGFVGYGDYNDYYRIDMKYNGFLTINFTSEFNSYTWIGKTHNTHSANGELGKPETLTERLKLEKGTYYLNASAWSGSVGGNYTMSFIAEPDFKDVTDRYVSAVMHLAKKDVTNGISASEFGVNDRIKRVDAAIWLAKILNLDTSDAHQTSYMDVPTRGWGAVNALKRENIANGKTPTHFGANDTMTRGEMALLLQRAYRLSGDGVALPFKDVSWRYEEAVKSLLKNGITQGKSANAFGTDTAITRGEMALFLYRADLKE